MCTCPILHLHSIPLPSPSLQRDRSTSVGGSLPPRRVVSPTGSLPHSVYEPLNPVTMQGSTVYDSPDMPKVSLDYGSHLLHPLNETFRGCLLLVLNSSTCILVEIVFHCNSALFWKETSSPERCEIPAGQGEVGNPNPLLFLQSYVPAIEALQKSEWW